VKAFLKLLTSKVEPVQESTDALHAGEVAETGEAQEKKSESKVDLHASRYVKQQGIFANEESTKKLEKDATVSLSVEPTTMEIDLGIAVKKPKKSGVSEKS